MRYSIRPAAATDARQLADIQVNSYRKAYRSLLPAEYLAHFSIDEQTSDWEAMIPVGKNELLLVAEHGSEYLLGYVYGRREDYRDFDCELVALHIRESVQHRGIGKALFLRTAEYFRGHGCRALVVWVLKGNPALDFYQKLGGELAGRKAWVNNAYFGVNVEELAVGWRNLDVFCRRAQSEEQRGISG